MDSKASARSRTLVIEGRAIPVAYEETPLDDVQLDPDNPRTRQQIGHLNGKATAEQLQKLILEIPGVPALQRAIRENKGVHDPIYVRADGRVAEGNCRTAIYLKLRHAQPNEPCWKRIPALRLPKDITEREIAVLQGSWHVAGKITWRAHEQAGHLHHMKSVLKMAPADISAALGISEREITRQIQAYETMRTKVIPRVKHGDGLKKFSYVLELYKNRKLEEFRQSPANIDFVTDLIVGNKLTQGSEVRDLHKVVNNPRAKEVLKREGLAKALAIVGKSDPTADSAVFRKLKGATATLKNLRKPELERIRDGVKEKQILQELSDALKNVASTAGVKLK